MLSPSLVHHILSLRPYPATLPFAGPTSARNVVERVVAVAVGATGMTEMVGEVTTTGGEGTMTVVGTGTAAGASRAPPTKATHVSPNQSEANIRSEENCAPHPKKEPTRFLTADSRFATMI